jgi:hypothetical protein
MYDCSLSRSGVPGKSSTASCSSAGAPRLSGRITERHEDNSSLRNYIIHLWAQKGVEFTQYVCRTQHTGRRRTSLIHNKQY